MLTLELLDARLDSSAGDGQPSAWSPEWEKFWLRVERRGPSECWPWRGPRNKRGYGMASASLRGAVQTFNAHVLAWAFTNLAVPLPEKFDVCVRHDCDYPPCCNSAHLRLGSGLQNHLDAIARERMPHQRAARRRLVRRENYWREWGVLMQPNDQSIADRALSPTERWHPSAHGRKSQDYNGHEQRMARYCARAASLEPHGGCRQQERLAECTLWNDAEPRALRQRRPMKRGPRRPRFVDAFDALAFIASPLAVGAA